MKYILILALQVIFFNTFGQTYYPYKTCDTEPDLKISSINISDKYTKIEFEYTKKGKTGQYIFLNKPGHKNAFYIKIYKHKYKLIKTENIGHKDRMTTAYPNKKKVFSAYFEPIPKSVKEFGLYEGKNGDWNFNNVKLENSIDHKGIKARESAFKFFDLLTKEYKKTKKWDVMFISIMTESIEEAVEYGIEDRDALILYGWARYMSREPEIAIRNFHYALSKYPNDPEILFYMGNCFEFSKKIDRAVYYWEKSGNTRSKEKIKRYTQ
ncbi:tetratricopeptide repeat protein [Flammeovirga aprica]|uniref:Tetratricopeptide repeat protein n=1 Tax=Flammeovirga aprica JL-4 TaxID=694437 RepID=A0A7X9NZ37_9BACT|nr:hypothetical protein [Flammeovirga aprica]NME66576.1 hypothetical protein [Flammeovirga aprica JL-4]